MMYNNSYSMRILDWTSSHNTFLMMSNRALGSFQPKTSQRTYQGRGRAMRSLIGHNLTNMFQYHWWLR